MSKCLNDLGLCRRAGALCMGTDAVKEAVSCKKGVLVVCSQFLSEKSKKEMRFLSQKYGVALCMIDHTFEEIGAIVGKPVGVLCITNESLAKKFLTNAEIQQTV